MPRKRRNRKNKKTSANNKKSETEAETALSERDTTIIPSSISITNILTPIRATPSPKINNNAVQFHRNNQITLPSTPINRERSFRRGNSEQTTPNFSNINLLFNLENACTPPEKNKPIRVNVATQTTFHYNPVIKCDVAVQFNDENENAITETPKINQLQFLDEINDKSFVLPKSNTLIQSCNVNPYLKTHPPETTELSFFASQFYNLKTASTPIDRVNYFRRSPKNDVETLKNEILALKRCYKSVSPKINRFVNHTKYCNKSHSISLLRQKSPIKNNLTTVCKHISLQEADQAFVDSALGARLYSRVKSFGRFTAKWTLRLIELCLELGITIRKGFSAIHRYYKKDEPAPTPTSCECATFKAEILTLTEKIDHLTQELETNKKIAEDTQHITKEKFLRDFNELKERLTALEEMKHDVLELKKKLSCAAPPPPPPLPAAAPPPPPPPPPPPMFNSSLNNPLKINGRRPLNAERVVREGATGTARPIISLDDILKVKLKKTSRDRSTPSLRTPQPIVSMDMLKQVKLRPASRSHTPISAALQHHQQQLENSTTPSSFSTSPHSSLTRMLSNVDVNVYKVKRLKRVSPYSFDDISRRNHLARLERDRTN